MNIKFWHFLKFIACVQVVVIGVYICDHNWIGHCIVGLGGIWSLSVLNEIWNDGYEAGIKDKK